MLLTVDGEEGQKVKVSLCEYNRRFRLSGSKITG